MKRVLHLLTRFTLVWAILLVSLAVISNMPTVAFARTRNVVTCKSALPAFDLSLKVRGATCKVARDVEVYMESHETCCSTPHVDGYAFLPSLAHYYMTGHRYNAHIHMERTGTKAHHPNVTVWGVSRHPYL